VTFLRTVLNFTPAYKEAVDVTAIEYGLDASPDQGSRIKSRTESLDRRANRPGTLLVNT
jgi:hypothetical protein